MNNPDLAAPAPAQGKIRKKKPLEWFAEAYPFRKGNSTNSEMAHENEFVLLQQKINSGPKNGVSLQD